GIGGTAAREAISLAVPEVDGIPVAIFAVNIGGAFLLGLLLEALARRGPDVSVPRTARILIGTGFLGGFTTYSALAADAAWLMGSGALATGIGYGLPTVVLGGLPRGRASPWRWPRTGRRPVRMSPSIPTAPRQPRSPAAPRRPREPQPTKRTRSSATEVCDDLARVLRHRCRRRVRRGPAHAARRDRQVPPHRSHSVGDDPHQRLGLARARLPHGSDGRASAARDLAPHHRHRVPRRIYDVLNSQRRDGPAGSGTQVGGEPGQCPRHAGTRDRCRGTGPVAGRTGLRPGPRWGPG